jgi:hypothetical protein
MSIKAAVVGTNSNLMVIFVTVCIIVCASGAFAQEPQPSECVPPCVGFTDTSANQFICACPSDIKDFRCSVPPCVVYVDPVTGARVCRCPPH